MQGPLLLYLASIVFHSDWCQRHRILKNIPVLTDRILLLELKKIVTLEPCGSMSVATGVPTFFRTNELVRKNYDGVQEIIGVLNEMLPNIATAVETSIEKRSVESGIMTIKTLEDRLFSLKKNVRSGDERYPERIRRRWNRRQCND